MKILIVDDHRENLLAMEAVLKSPDYDLVFASSGKEALKCLLKDDFAVILLDIQMPGMDGFETAKLIRARKRNEDTPIIFITAIYRSRENMAQGYSLGAIDYLFKPFNPEMLKSKIEAFVKIHYHKQQIKLQNELLKLHALELETMNQSLEQTTSELRKAEALARVIGETSIDTMITMDALGRVMNSNPAITTMFGYEQEELQGQHASILFLGDNFSFLNIKNDLVINKSSKILDTMAVHKNGETFPVEIQIGVARIRKQHIFVLSVKDITERKQLEKERKDRYKTLEKLVQEQTGELIETNQKLKKEIFERKKIGKQLKETGLRLNNILESITDVFFTLDHYEQFIFVNKEAENYWQRGREELIGRNIWEVFPESFSSFQPFFQKSMKTKEAAHFEIRGRSNTAYEVHVYPYEEGLSVYYHDISERRMFEKEMARLDRLNLIGQMAAGIGHEVRNPMTTVRGFLQLLGGKEEFKQSKTYFELMIEELDRANAIISEFLSLAKTKTVDLKQLSLNSLIENLFPLIKADALVRDMNIKIDLQDVVILSLDEKEIRQLILNLVRNGMEAMSASGGTLTIRTFMDGKEVVLAVEDEGCGIKTEILEKVGTPFFTTKENGTGLGLATCYSITARHDAKIDIDTGPSGTTFFVRFKSELKNEDALVTIAETAEAAETA